MVRAGARYFEIMARAFQNCIPFRACGLAVLLVLLAAGSPVRAQTTAAQVSTDVNTVSTDFDNFNLISFGDTTISSYGDISGGLAVDANLSLSGTGNISQTVTTNNATLYVTGQLTVSGTTTLDSGYAYLPNLTKSQWTWSSSAQTLTSKSSGGAIDSSPSGAPQAKDNPIGGTTAPTGLNFSGLQSSLGTISTSLSNASTNLGTISVSGGNLLFTAAAGQTSGVAVFNLNVSGTAGAGVLSGNTYNGQSISNVTVNVPAGLTYVINVLNAGGQTIFGSGVNLNSGTNDNQLLWNIVGSGTVTIAAQSGETLYGSVLAPNATIDSTSVINGEVVANGFSDCGVELNQTDFAPAIVTTPEPATYALWAVGICVAGVALRRLQRLRGLTAEAA
jgi:choice-of-anchor A domain-containing protein